MTLSGIEVIEAVYAARRRRDIDAVLALCSDAVIFTCNADPDRPGSGNTMIGKAQNRAHLELIDDIWEPVSSSPGPLRVVPRMASSGEMDAGVPPATSVRCHVSFALRHKASGQILEGTKTHEWTVRSGLVVSLCETLDRHFIHAFMQMSGAFAGARQPASEMSGIPAEEEEPSRR